ncbi:MAG: hypothetical protein KAY04_05915, partial [Burkholderiales bacterium]|nr:hypothetical protein [Burkholderiales bacterium]
MIALPSGLPRIIRTQWPVASLFVGSGRSPFNAGSQPSAGTKKNPARGEHLSESSILQNRRGTRYLMFDDSATIADVFALRCRTSPNAPAYREFDSASKQWNGIDWREAGDRVARMREGLR